MPYPLSNQPDPTIPEAKPASLAGLKVLVVGLGRFGGGVSVSRWLVDQGATVTITDRAPAASLAESIAALSDLSVDFRLGDHDESSLEGKDLVVVNPAVDKTRSEFFHAITHRDIAWTTEMNLFCERCPAPVVGITGSYGKSTTAAMLAHVLEDNRQRDSDHGTGVHLGGNIGRSLLPELDRILPTDLVVLEMSSAQLEDTPKIGWTPNVAVITNLSAHHLDRYGAYDKYLAMKLNILSRGDETQAVVIGDLEPEAQACVRRARAEQATAVTQVVRPGIPFELIIPGEHNQSNAACTLAIGCQLGLSEASVRDALRTFSGLPHRLQRVREIGNVVYYNDSKSTAPATTVKALDAIPGPTIAIVGGQKKDVELHALAVALVRKCRLVICTGESAATFERAIRASAQAGRDTRADESLVVRRTANLQDAVDTAHAEARPGDTVLFSPGAPSYDAFPNFVERGHAFTEAVNRLT